MIHEKMSFKNTSTDPMIQHFRLWVHTRRKRTYLSSHGHGRDVRRADGQTRPNRASTDERINTVRINET